MPPGERRGRAAPQGGWWIVLAASCAFALMLAPLFAGSPWPGAAEQDTGGRAPKPELPTDDDGSVGLSRLHAIAQGHGQRLVLSMGSRAQARARARASPSPSSSSLPASSGGTAAAGLVGDAGRPRSSSSPPPSHQTRPCLGVAADGVPLPGEEAPRSGYLVNVSGGCPSTYLPCATAYKKAITTAWDTAPGDAHSDLHAPWNYFREASWGPRFDGYAAAAAGQAGFEVPLVRHFAARFPAMVVAEALRLPPWAASGGADAAEAAGAEAARGGDTLSPAWAPALEPVLHGIAAANGSFRTMCTTNEYRFVLAPTAAKGNTPDLLAPDVHAPHKPSTAKTQLWNLGPFVEACTHTLVWDTVQQNCSTLRAYFLDRLEGDLAPLYAPKFQKRMRKAFEAAERAGQLDSPGGCRRTMLMPRAVPVPNAAKPAGANIVCSMLHSWKKPLSNWKWGGLQQLDGWARDSKRAPKAAPNECRGHNEGPHYEDGNLFNGSNPRVIAHLAAALKTVSPFVLVTHRAGGDKSPWDEIGYGRMLWQVKSSPWENTDESWAIAQERNPDAAALLQMPEMLAWFSGNPSFKHPKLHALPAGPRCPVVKELGQSAIGGGARRPRALKLLVNFGASTMSWDCECVRTMLLATSAQRWPFATVLPPTVLKKLGFLSQPNGFRRLLQAFRFVLSPPGSGWDCFRTYEIIAAGGVPIVLRTGTGMDTMYDRLPVLYVNTYDDITEELLDREWQRLSRQAHLFDFERLSSKFWADRIRKASVA